MREAPNDHDLQVAIGSQIFNDIRPESQASRQHENTSKTHDGSPDCLRDVDCSDFCSDPENSHAHPVTTRYIRRVVIKVDFSIVSRSREFTQPGLNRNFPSRSSAYDQGVLGFRNDLSSGSRYCWIVGKPPQQSMGIEKCAQLDYSQAVSSLLPRIATPK